jgi:hypothetical protein
MFGRFASYLTSNMSWELELYSITDSSEEAYNHGPSFVLEDLNNDGGLEAVVAGIQRDETGECRELAVHVVGAITGEPLNSQWPKRFPVAAKMIPKVHVGDVAGDAAKEVVFYVPGEYASGAAWEDQYVGDLHVLDLSGQAVAGWPMPLKSTYEPGLPLQVADVDADGKAEILVKSSLLLEGDGSVAPGWPAPRFYNCCHLCWGDAQAVNLDSDPELEVLQYDYTLDESGEWVSAVAVVEHDGSVAEEWPVLLDTPMDLNPGGSYFRKSDLHAKVVQLDSTPAPEIVLAFDKIRVLSASGESVGGLPVVDLEGECKGLELVDVDDDGALEYVVLVHRGTWGNQVATYSPSGRRRGAFLEAYELSGEELGGGWPIHLPWYPGSGIGSSVLVRNVEGNRNPEVIRIRGNMISYDGYTNDGYLSLVEILGLP